MFTNFKDERTQGGIGVDVDPLKWNGEFEDLELEMELCDDETDKEKEIEELDDEYEEIRNE